MSESYTSGLYFVYKNINVKGLDGPLLIFILHPNVSKVGQVRYSSIRVRPVIRGPWSGQLGMSPVISPYFYHVFHAAPLKKETTAVDTK